MKLGWFCVGVDVVVGVGVAVGVAVGDDVAVSTGEVVDCGAPVAGELGVELPLAQALSENAITTAQTDSDDILMPT